MRENKIYDFKLVPLWDESSCREMILPIVPIKVGPGDLVIGRPMFQGCPITHVIKVISQDKWGIIEGWMVGMLESRANEPIEIGPYNVLGFHGLAVGGKPKILTRQRFLPANCMMQCVHTGVVNFIKGKEVKLESILI